MALFWNTLARLVLLISENYFCVIICYLEIFFPINAIINSCHRLDIAISMHLVCQPDELVMLENGLETCHLVVSSYLISRSMNFRSKIHLIFIVIRTKS